MEKESNFLPKAKSDKWTWIIIAIVMLCAALIFLIIVAGVFFLRPFWSNKTAVPDPQIIPTVQTSPVVPSVPIESPFVDTLPILDYKADPLFGSVSLQRGFSPDPHIVAAVAGGTVDTLDLNLDCGFTSYKVCAFPKTQNLRTQLSKNFVLFCCFFKQHCFARAG